MDPYQQSQVAAGLAQATVPIPSSAPVPMPPLAPAQTVDPVYQSFRDLSGVVADLGGKIAKLAVLVATGLEASAVRDRKHGDSLAALAEAVKAQGVLVATLESRLETIQQLAQARVSLPGQILDRLEAINERLDRIEQGGVQRQPGFLERAQAARDLLFGRQAPTPFQVTTPKPVDHAV